jgi:hypothetical protein
MYSKYEIINYKPTQTWDMSWAILGKGLLPWRPWFFWAWFHPRVIINIEKLLIFENVHVSFFSLKIYQNFKSNKIVFTISWLCFFYFNIINLLISSIHSKFTRNLLFHEFMFFAHGCHVFKTCMMHI